VCVRAVPQLQERQYRITGIVVLDVVEGEFGVRCAYPDNLILMHHKNSHWRLFLICMPFFIPAPQDSTLLNRASNGSKFARCLTTKRAQANL
jgi:hypothetical protein